jgi:hypothetical protein
MLLKLNQMKKNDDLYLDLAYLMLEDPDKGPGMFFAYMARIIKETANERDAVKVAQLINKIQDDC